MTALDVMPAIPPLLEPVDAALRAFYERTGNLVVLMLGSGTYPDVAATIYAESNPWKALVIYVDGEVEQITRKGTGSWISGERSFPLRPLADHVARWLEVSAL
jgi:hypothetical protein